MNKAILRAGLASALAICITHSWASCTSALSSYDSYVISANAVGAGAVVAENPHCFGGGQATSGPSIRSTAFFQAFAISNALDQRNTGDGPVLASGPEQRGMSAGSTAGRWNVWSNLGTNNTRQSYNTQTFVLVGVKNRMDVTNTVIGADYGLSSSSVLGVSGAFDDGSGAGTNTVGGAASNQTRGYMIAPYFGMQLSKAWSVDVSAGLGRGELETPTTDSNASRWFAGANLSYNRWFDNIQLTGKASYLHAVENYGDIKDDTLGKINNSDARNTLGQVKLAGQIGYWMNGVMPVASIAYVNDIRRNTTQFGATNNPIGRDGWLLGVGLNFYSVKDGVTGGVVYNREFGRSNQNLESLMANINIRF